jgi:hypothetical protein
MPLFAWIGRDGPRGVELRALHREEHLRGLEPLDRAGRIRFAGPLLDDAGRPAGSVIVFEAGSLADARAVAEADAYARRGIFASWEVFETRAVFPQPKE